MFKEYRFPAAQFKPPSKNTGNNPTITGTHHEIPAVDTLSDLAYGQRTCRRGLAAKRAANQILADVPLEKSGEVAKPVKCYFAARSRVDEDAKHLLAFGRAQVFLVDDLMGGEGERSDGHLLIMVLN